MCHISFYCHSPRNLTGRQSQICQVLYCSMRYLHVSTTMFQSVLGPHDLPFARIPKWTSNENLAAVLHYLWFQYCGMLRCVAGLADLEVSTERSVFTLKNYEVLKMKALYVPSKRLNPSTPPRSVTCHKTRIFNINAVETLTPPQWYILPVRHTQERQG